MSFEPTPRTGILRLTFLSLAAIFLMLGISIAAQAATFHVTSTGDNGDNFNPTPGSLRKAIIDANANPGPDLIDFQIPGGGVQTISLAAELTISGPVTIDGYTQPGASKNTLANGDNAVLLIQIDGTNAGAGYFGVGFHISGGQTTIRGLVINRFENDAIAIGPGDPGGNTIEGCFIGTDTTGTVALANLSKGIYINQSSNNVIGGPTPAQRNVISGNGNNNNGDGISITGTSLSGMIIQGNYIGTNASGTAAVGNKFNGINISGGTNMKIGGTGPGAGNLISGNLSGIVSQEVDQLLVQANYIGTDVTGTIALGNKYHGIRLGITTNSTIGGPVAGARNIISGTISGNGISLEADTKGNLIQGNYIGTDVSGSIALANGGSGVATLYGTGTAPSNNKIGGAAAGEGNVISGNKVHGVSLSSDLGSNTVQGNLIGTNAAGTGALPNGDPVSKAGNGIFLGGSSNNVIGGTTAGARNVISGNVNYGIQVSNGSNSNSIQANLIGTDVNSAPMGNGNTGIYVMFSSTNIIGGGAANAGNTIAFNANGGITLSAPAGLSTVNANTINANVIYSNQPIPNQTAGLGIDLGGDGVTANDDGDSDGGANNRQNYPVLTSANSSGGTTTITGTLNSDLNQQYRIEFFASTQCDPSGSGEGEVYLGSTSVTTAGNDATINVTLPVSVQPGYVITSTATDSAGNTSEFSQCALLSGLAGPGTLQFTAATYSVNESAGTATITVSRAAGNSNPVSVHYSTSAGSASAGTDYANTSGTLNWGVGDLSDKTFTVAINDDSLNENNETINVTLNNPTGGAKVGSPGSAVLTILDDDPQPTMSIADTSVAEGNSGTTPATFTVSLSAPSAKNVNVHYSTVAGTALANSDYQPKSNLTVSFNPGQTTATISINVIGDTTQEPDEAFSVQLSAPGNATIGKSQGVCTIFNDDGGQPQPTISISDLSHAEGNSGTTSFDFTVSLSAASNQSVTVNYATADGTAMSGTDYQTANSSLSFAAGETSKTISVLVVGETQDEPNETFLVNLSNPVNATLAKAQGVGTIVNDDNVAAPTLQFSQSNYSVQEDLAALTITVTRVGDTSGTASVDYATNDKTASQKGDFEYAAGRLTFGPGDTLKTFQVLINEDDYAEGSETVGLALSNLTGASMGPQATATITIVDDTPEALTNPIDDAQSFVYMQYHDFLNREPDAAGLAFWTNQITSCGADQACIEVKRANVSAAFYLSIEFQNTGYLVYRTYKAAYGNLSGAPVPVRFNEFVADTDTVQLGVVVNQAGWAQKLESNKQAFLTSFVQRPKFTLAYPDSLTPAQFVDQLSANAGLNPSPGDRLTAINEFGGSPSTIDTAARAHALRDVAENPILVQQELNRAFVLMQYFGYLRRDPDAAPEPGLNYDGYNFWLNKLDQFKGNYNDAEMVKAFIASLEYRQRFGQ